jgi:hypothetical protein
MPSPNRAELLRRNIALREREDEIRDILSDDDLDSDEKLDAIEDLVDDTDDADQEGNEEEN